MARSKFNVGDSSTRAYNGIVFDSAVEMKYYRDVILPQHEAGEIIEYELQKEYILQPKFKHEGKIVQPIKYVADFYIKYADGSEKVVDTKGFPDATALLKRKIFWYVFPDVDYQWVSYVKKYGGWIEYEELKKKRRESKKAAAQNG